MTDERVNIKRRDLVKLIEDDQLITQLAHAKEVGASRAILTAVKNKLVIDRDLYENKPRIILEGDITKDFRYRAGRISLAKEILDLPDDAQSAH